MCARLGFVVASSSLPIHEFSQASGDCSVIGGYVYRVAQAAVSVFGLLLGLDPVIDPDLARRVPVRVTTGDPTPFGEASNGELYLAGGSRVYRIGSTLAPKVPALPWPALAALALGLFGAGYRSRRIRT